MTGSVTQQPADQTARDRIRTHHHETLFVTAGAGTGKTTALVSRVVEMVLTGHLEAMSGLAAITFTENAAAELRTRIRASLERAATGAVSDRSLTAEEASRCRAAAASIDEAAITTLHGFAARILGDYPLEAGLPPGFAVQDSLGARLGSLAAWPAFVDRLLEDESVTEHLLSGLTLGLKLDDLHTVADAFEGSWDQLLDRPFHEVPLTPVDAGPVLRPLQQALAYLPGAPAGHKLADYLRESIEPLVDELSALSEPLDVLEALHQHEIKHGVGSATSWPSVPRVKALLKAAAEEQKDQLDAVGAAVAETLCARLQEHVLAEAQRRRRDGQLSFHDLLVLARDLLRDDPEVRRAVNQRYPVILVDEFQDTDPLQVEIACLIAGDCGEAPPAHWSHAEVPAGRLFFVGDPKQSIYRFRRADVELFTAVGDKHRDGHTRLDVNFRSVPGILDAVNTVFGELIGGAEHQVAYADLVPHRPPENDTQSSVTLLGAPGDYSAAEARELEAAHVAATISRAKGEGLNGGARVSYANIAVLLPTRTSLPTLESALQAAGIPYRIESRSLVWATDQVRDLVTMLQAIDNPADEVAVVAALRHPALACSDVDLVTWAAAGGRWSYLVSHPDEVAADHPVALGLATLRRYHDLRWWLPVNVLVERIVRELRLVELTAGLRRPRDHWRRIRFLVDQARAFCDAGGSGLGEFVAWAVAQIESDVDVLETVVPEPDDDAVRILTVHGAKGLEFPVTIVTGLGSGLRSEASVRWGGRRPEARLRRGLATADFDETAKVEGKKDRAEWVRLLYVAMTRARDHLVLTCYHKPTKSGYGSHAQQLWKLLGGRPDLVRLEPEPQPVPPTPQEADAAWVTPELSRDAFLAERAALLHAVTARTATSATGLVAESHTGGANLDGDEPVLENPPPEVAEVAGQPVLKTLPSPSGAAIGTAVHAVLEQLSTLDAPTAAEVMVLARAAAVRGGLAELADDIAGRVRTALLADVVATAARSGKYWREVYVVMRDGERHVEGYIDLLTEHPNGDLAVVDYKTDRVRSAAERRQKEEQYRPQLEAYARAIAGATGRRVGATQLVFAGPAATR